MSCGAFGLLGGVLVSVCSAQAAANSVEIKLPPGVASDSFFVRYVLTGEEFGGWIQPRAGVSSYAIDTAIDGRAATGIRAILYVPGCALQTFNLALSATNNPQYSFVCQPVPSVSLAGAVIRNDRLYGRNVNVQARYVVRWPVDNIVTSIPIGKAAELSADGHFSLTIPDLSPGELQIWAKDKTNDTVVAQLIPTVPQALKAHMGGFKLQSAYPAEIVFVPCAASPGVHDPYGFSLRPDAGDACDRPW